jgi:hypothetical protein
VARDITAQLQSVLAARRPMSLDHQDFEKVRFAVVFALC